MLIHGVGFAEWCKTQYCHRTLSVRPSVGSQCWSATLIVAQRVCIRHCQSVCPQLGYCCTSSREPRRLSACNIDVSRPL